MNVITSHHAICLFPLETLVYKRGVINNRRTSGLEKWQRALEKYRARGWDLHELNSETRSSLSSMSYHWDTERWLGDRKCLTIPLNETNTIVPDLVMINSWRIILRGYGPTPIIKTHTLKGFALEFYYTCGSMGLRGLYKEILSRLDVDPGLQCEE
jgi:hypothetical protein